MIDLEIKVISEKLDFMEIEKITILKKPNNELMGMEILNKEGIYFRLHPGNVDFILYAIIKQSLQSYEAFLKKS